MQNETRQCQNCKKDFTIGPDDMIFLNKFKITAPNFCHECRLQRKLTWRNERTLYKRNCTLCDTTIISVFSTDKPFPVYCYSCYHGTGWNPFSYGQDVDFSRPFLEQFRELQRRVPRQYALVFNNINSDYTNGTGFNKNCYLIFVSDNNEDCFYSYNIYHCKNSLDLSTCFNCEYSYELTNCINCQNCFFSIDCRDSYNTSFSRDCINCHDILGCVGLRNKSYCIFNVSYSKDEYQRRIKDMNIDDYNSVTLIKQQAYDFFKKYPVKYIHGSNNKNVVGDMVNNSKNSYSIFTVKEIEDCKYIINGNKAKDCYECYVVGDGAELCFDSLGCVETRNTKASHLPWSSYELEYCDSCETSSNLFGCVSLKHSKNCILNKQYSEDEYLKLKEKIIGHMKNMPFKDKNGRVYNYGEFFPAELSPYDYNETIAIYYFPLNKKEALGQGYSWKYEEQKEYNITINSKDLPNKIKNVDDSILNEVIYCIHKGECNDQCTTAFKITNGELQLYKKLNLPLPRLCHNCRYYERLKLENPKKLWKRKCNCYGEKSGNGLYKNTAEHIHGKEHCPNQFETSYAPERPEIVYCETCYNAEVY